MATYGARGNTEKQMRASLRMPKDNAVGKNGFQSLLDSLHVSLINFLQLFSKELKNFLIHKNF